MSNNKDNVVKIATSELNLYAQIVRACVSGKNACAKLHDKKHMDAFDVMLAWATSNHQEAAEKTCCSS